MMFWSGLSGAVLGGGVCMVSDAALAGVPLIVFLILVGVELPLCL